MFSFNFRLQIFQLVSDNFTKMPPKKAKKPPKPPNSPKSIQAEEPCTPENSPKSTKAKQPPKPTKLEQPPKVAKKAPVKERKKVPQRGTSSTKMTEGDEIKKYNEQELLWLRQLCREMEGSASKKAFQKLLDDKHPLMLKLMSGANQWEKPRTPSALHYYCNSHGQREGVAAWTPGERREAEIKMENMEGEIERLKRENERLTQENIELKTEQRVERRRADDLTMKIFQENNAEFEEVNLNPKVRIERLKVGKDLLTRFFPPGHRNLSTQNLQLDTDVQSGTEDNCSERHDSLPATEDETTKSSSSVQLNEAEITTSNVAEVEDQENNLMIDESCRDEEPNISVEKNAESDSAPIIDTVTAAGFEAEVVATQSTFCENFEASSGSNVLSLPSQFDEDITQRNDEELDDNNNNVSKEENTSNTSENTNVIESILELVLQEVQYCSDNQVGTGLSVESAPIDVNTNREPRDCVDDNWSLHLSDDSQENAKTSDLSPEHLFTASSPPVAKTTDDTDASMTPVVKKDEYEEKSDYSEELDEFASDLGEFDSDFEEEISDPGIERLSANEVEISLGKLGNEPTDDDVQSLIQSLQISHEDTFDDEDLNSNVNIIIQSLQHIDADPFPSVNNGTSSSIVSPIVPVHTDIDQEVSRIYHGTGIQGFWKTKEAYEKEVEYKRNTNRLNLVDEPQSSEEIDPQTVLDKEIAKNLNLEMIRKRKLRSEAFGRKQTKFHSYNYAAKKNETKRKVAEEKIVQEGRDYLKETETVEIPPIKIKKFRHTPIVWRQNKLTYKSHRLVYRGTVLQRNLNRIRPIAVQNEIGRKRKAKDQLKKKRKQNRNRKTSVEHQTAVTISRHGHQWHCLRVPCSCDAGDSVNEVVPVLGEDFD